MKTARGTAYRVGQHYDDEVDAHLTLDSDSTDRRATTSSGSNTTRGVISVATQTDENECRWFSCSGKVMTQRAVLAVATILIVLMIMLMERFIGVDIVDERQLIQGIAAQLIPSVASAVTITMQAQNETAQ
jgi:translation initiation factor 2 gamma subunit (eIF-2gamma)